MSYYDRQAAPFRALDPRLLPEKEPEGEAPLIQEDDHDLSKMDHWGSMAIILGWGDGSMMRSLLRKGGPRIGKKQIIWVIFQCEMEHFARSLKNKISPDYNQGLLLAVFVARDEHDVLQVTHRLSASHAGIPLFGSLDIIDHHPLIPEAEKIRPEFRAGIRRSLEEKLSMPGNCPSDAWDGVRNSILNLPRLIDRPSTDVMDNVLDNAPVIAVGAGPHLQEHVDDLREAQQKAYIFCAESAMGALLKNDIHPDMVCPMERVPETEEWCRPAAESNVWFGGIAVVPPGAVEHFGDRLLLVPGSDKIVDWYDPARDLSRMWTGHTTCVLGLSLARWMTLGDIYLVGQDLSYGPTGKSHWSEVADYSPTDREYYNGEPCMLDGNCGEKVRSTKIWHTIIGQISEINRQNTSLLNLNPIKSVMAHDKMGAYVPGLDPAPFPSHLPKLDKLDFAKLPLNPERKAYWTQCLDILPWDWQQAVNYFERAFATAHRFGADHPGNWPAELWNIASAASVFGGVTCYSRPITRYLLHNLFYNGALQTQIRRRVHSAFKANCRIAECLRSILHDTGMLMRALQPMVVETCQKAKSIL